MNELCCLFDSTEVFVEVAVFEMPGIGLVVGYSIEALADVVVVAP